MQRGFLIDAPRVVGAWLGKAEYMAMQSSFKTSGVLRREGKKKNIIRHLAEHLHKHYYLGGIAKERARAGAKWALEHSVDFACHMFDPMLEGKFAVAHTRNVLCQLLGPGKRKIGKNSGNLTGAKEAYQLGQSLDREKTGYVSVERFKQWYVRVIGLQVGRYLIEPQLTGKGNKSLIETTHGVDGKMEIKVNEGTDSSVHVDATQYVVQTASVSTAAKKKPGRRSFFNRKKTTGNEGTNNTKNELLANFSHGTELRMPAAEAALFEAGKWLIRDHAAEHFRASGSAVGREPAAKRTIKEQHHHPFVFELLHHNDQKLLPRARELYRTTMPRFLADARHHRKPFGTLKALNMFVRKVRQQNQDALNELKYDPRPLAGSTVHAALRWLMMDGSLQKDIRRELLQIEDNLSNKTNQDTLKNDDKNNWMNSLKNREHAKDKGKYRLLASRIAAEEERKRLEQEALMEALGDPGKHHELADHNKPVRFMLQSFEDAHEYRARWKNVDDRLGRNGKKMKTYHGTCYASARNEQGMCQLTIKAPRVGTYRVDIEQRFGYHSKHTQITKSESNIPTSAMSKGLRKVSEVIDTAEESAGKCVHRLRQVVQQSKWEAVAGSPKYIVAKFQISGNSVAAKMQDERPDDAVKETGNEILSKFDLDNDEEEANFNNLGKLDINNSPIVGRRQSWMKEKSMQGEMRKVEKPL